MTMSSSYLFASLPLAATVYPCCGQCGYLSTDGLSEHVPSRKVSKIAMDDGGGHYILVHPPVATFTEAKYAVEHCRVRIPIIGSRTNHNQLQPHSYDYYSHQYQLSPMSPVSPTNGDIQAHIQRSPHMNDFNVHTATKSKVATDASPSSKLKIAPENLNANNSNANNSISFDLL